jgi:hypothetical protein
MLLERISRDRGRDRDVTVTRHSALGCWVKEGERLVVHFSLEGVAKINTP